MATRFVVCREIGPGKTEVVTDPKGLDQAEEAAELMAAGMDGWADRSFDWRPGDREGVLALWAQKPVRGDPAVGGRPVGSPKRTGYTVMADPDVPR